MTATLSRREMLRGIAGVGGALAAVTTTSASTEEHPAHPVAPPDAIGMLYDSTICTGCKACMPACNEANGLPSDTLLSGGIWDMPTDLNSETKNIIKLYQDPDRDPGGQKPDGLTAPQGQDFAFVKRQCMHCLDPACVSGCPFDALQKSQWGAVTWNSSLCIGCRYCEVSCPFEVPKFQWDKWNPKIVKCEFCYDQRLLENKEPACTAVCPTGAVVFGKRADLLAKAKERIANAPHKYFEDRVYGEHEAGGTQVLYLSSVAFDKLGLPRLGTTSLGHYATKVTSKIYKWFSGPLVMAALFGFVIKRNWDRHEEERPAREKESGVPDQL